MLRYAVVFAFAVFLIGTASARTLRIAADGSGNYTTVQPCFDASQNGDTILVSPGTFGISSSDVYTLVNRTDIVLSGAAYYGPSQSALRGKLLLNGCSSCEVWSLNVGWGIDIRGGTDNEIRRCYFVGTSPAVVDTASRNLTFADNFFWGGSNPTQLLMLGGTGRVVGCAFATGNSYHCFDARNPGTGFWQVVNCTFAAGLDLFPAALSRDFVLEMRNNIIYGLVGLGYTWPLVDWSYNASSLFLPGTGNIVLNQAPFINWSGNPATADLRLAANSPCWDAGDPVIHDRYARDHDAHRSDIGCYGGPTPFYPDGYTPIPAPNAAVSLTATPVVTVGDSLLIRTTARIVPRY